MVATIINAIAIVIGTVIGLAVGGRLHERSRHAIFTAVGVVSTYLGLSMMFETGRVLYLALSLVIGGLAGTALRIEDRIEAIGERLRRRVERPVPQVAAAAPADTASAATPGDAHVAPAASTFARGFLAASVLFCVGALAILGSFQAGVEGSYALLLTKSVMDGFMSILLSAAWGPGVGFAALSVLVYQGALTLLSSAVSPFVTDLMLQEISAVGGAMVVMIGLGLLELRTARTADFLPALLVVVVLVLVDPWIGGWVL